MKRRTALLQILEIRMEVKRAKGQPEPSLPQNLLSLSSKY